ncbi:MAG: hypothetical protein U0174_11260 [Polyangiaceae bacterium]
MHERLWARVHARNVSFSVALMLSLGCGFVREVRRTPTGGEVAIRGRTSGTEKEAADLMNARCGGAGYDVLEEGEVVVGQQTVTQSQGQGTVTQTRSGRITTVNTYSQGTSSTQNTTEWRILYQCKGSAPTATPAPAQGPAGTPPAPPANRPESRGPVHELRLRF